jgi:hypothetical protein
LGYRSYQGREMKLIPRSLEIAVEEILDQEISGNNEEAS